MTVNVVMSILFLKPKQQADKPFDYHTLPAPMTL